MAAAYVLWAPGTSIEVNVKSARTFDPARTAVRAISGNNKRLIMGVSIWKGWSAKGYT